MCFIQFSSSLVCKIKQANHVVKQQIYIQNIKQNEWSSAAEQTVKSSRAWAPLLSFLASAECIVMHALINKFSNSMVSIKSEFLRSNKIESQRNENMHNDKYKRIAYQQPNIDIKHTKLSCGLGPWHHENSPMFYQLIDNLQMIHMETYCQKWITKSCNNMGSVSVGTQI